jgi:hypothetical protein
MRLEERCKCGAEIVVVFEAGRRHEYTSHETDRYVAERNVKDFRRRHKPCLGVAVK